MKIAEEIQKGQAALGIELSSTRIKAVLIGSDNNPIASGGHGWENTLRDGVWMYPLEEVWAGIQAMPSGTLFMDRLNPKYASLARAAGAFGQAFPAKARTESVLRTEKSVNFS